MKRGSLALAPWLLVACAHAAPVPPSVVRAVPLASIPGHAYLALDTSHKEPERLLPAEVYVRSYLALFGGLAPIDVQNRARPGGLFDTWNDYLSALGLPDYRADIPRNAQTNAIMVATFERLGAALCDRAAEHDLHATPHPAVADRLLFRFDPPAAAADDARAFAAPFDLLHRRFLGYPAALAPTDRAVRFHALYRSVVARHAGLARGRSALAPAEAGWAAVCEGLIRHPEFQLY